jgi:DNA-binding protein Fis
MENEEYLGTDNLNLHEIEKKVILKALEKTSWNQSRSAVLLGITRKQLRTKIKNLGLIGDPA